MGSGGVGGIWGNGNSSCLKLFYLTSPFKKYPNFPNVGLFSSPNFPTKFAGGDSLGDNRGDCGGGIRGG